MQEKHYDGFTCNALSEQHQFYCGLLPEELVFSKAQFEYVWDLHPRSTTRS